MRSLHSMLFIPVRRIGSLGNLSHKPSLNLWMANLAARELRDASAFLLCPTSRISVSR
jgi:hypothetical protein